MQRTDIEQLKNVYRSGFPDDTEKYIDFFFEKYVKPENIVFYKENGKIISAGYIIEKHAVIFGKNSVFPYITALSTLPEYRGKGKIRFVLLKTFEILRQRGYAFFGLHPFDYGYYKRFGLENISYACHSTILGGKNYKIKEYAEEDFQTVKEIYDAMSLRFDNKLILSKDMFELKIGEYAADGISCKLLYDDGKCFAFVFIDGNKIDFYATTNIEKFSFTERFKGYFYYNFFKSDDPYLQGRIIDVKKALKEYYSANMPDKEIRIKIKDELIAENNVCISVKKENGRAVIADCDFAERVYEIGEFTGDFFNNVKNFFPDKY